MARPNDIGSTFEADVFADARRDVAAGIVVFRPEPARLLALARAVASECGALYIFVNAVIEAATCEALAKLGARLIRSDVNLGIGEAQNILALSAILDRRQRIVLFDQDSALTCGAVIALAETMDRLEQTGENPAVVGPRIMSPPGEEQRYKAPRYFPRRGRPSLPTAIPVQYVIASGSLIDLARWRRVGPMRSDFFIDAIDVEWCFRAWARGFSCWVCPDVALSHTIGAGRVGGGLLGPPLPDQAPFRLYAYVRNQIFCLRLAHIPLAWRVRFLVHVVRMVLVHTIGGVRRGAGLGLFLRAAWAGLCGRLGPPPGAEGTLHLTSTEAISVHA